MKLPPIPSLPHFDLPPQLVIPMEALAAFWAMTHVILGFVYLLFGIKVFRVMTTIGAVFWGAGLGVILGTFIGSVTAGMILCATALGFATWFYTRWMVALPIGLAAAALGWGVAGANGANPLAAFLISLASAVAFGGPVLMFYRTIIIGLTCLQGAILVVIGTSTAILLIRHTPLTHILNDPYPSGRLILGAGCVLVLAVPAFYYQRLRYPAGSDIGEDFEEGISAYEVSPKKKAA